MRDFSAELEKYGLDVAKYEQLLSDIDGKLNGENDYDWSELKDKYSVKCNPDTMRKASATIFGGKFRTEYEKSKKVETPNGELDDKILEMRKERIKLSDARTEYNRIIRQEARKESYADMVKRIICEDVEPMSFNTKKYKSFDSSNDLLCSFSDVHTGIEIDLWNNKFNQDILKTRVEYYTSKIIEVRDIHDSQDCYLVIGEIVSGLIHNNLRLQNNMDLMEQFKYISELISAMLEKLSEHFNHVYVFTTPGNHSRITPKKEDSLDGENMDLLLPFYLKARMQNHENITICDNTIDPEIAMFVIRGNSVFAAHGHKDSPNNVVQNFTLNFKVQPNIVLLGHRHTNGLVTEFDTKVLQAGCISGTDNFASSIRKSNNPEQVIAVITEADGLLCMYDVQLNK